MAPQNLLDDTGIVLTEKALAFVWLVTCGTDEKYTIQIEQIKEHATTRKQDNVVVIANNEQFYSIKCALEEDGKIYYQIWTEENRCFKYNGDDKAVTAVEYDPTNERNFLWLFYKESSSSTSGPYKLYSGNFDYFQYNGITEENPLLDRFGLKDDSDYRWPNFWANMSKLNQEGNGKTFYKVIFLGRHGHATNNPGVTAKDRPIRDSPLTQDGFLQASNVQAMWTKENSLDKGGIGIPTISYCSPLMRCLSTNSISFAPQLDASGGPTINTVVYEDCRERVSTSKAEHRRSKACITQMFPKFGIDPNFADEDPLWAEHESHESVMLRAEHILERIFEVESKNNYRLRQPPPPFVSITAHSGIISAFLSFIGFDSRSFHIVNGCVIPVICQYTPADDTILPDGFYKIQYVPQPSLFADGILLGDPVIASGKKDFVFPSTWITKCLDVEQRVYTIQLMRPPFQGTTIPIPPMPQAYWNASIETPISGHHRAAFHDVFVILDTSKRAWRLIPSDKAGEYIIELVEGQPPSSTTSHESVTLVGVKSDGIGDGTGNNTNILGKPLILKREKDVGPNTPRWKFVHVWFPLALVNLSLKDVLKV